MTLQPLIDHFESYLPFDEREKQALEGHPARVKKLIAIGAGEQLPGLRRVIFDTNELAKLDTLYWEQLALMPEPKEYRSTRLNWPFLQHDDGQQRAVRQHPLPRTDDGRRVGPECPAGNDKCCISDDSDSQLCIVSKAEHTVFLKNFPAVWVSTVPFLKP